MSRHVPRASSPLRRHAALFLLFVFGSGASATVWSQTPSPATVSSPTPEVNLSRAVAGEVNKVFATCKRAVVRIRAVDRHGTHVGTGFFVDPHGTIFTDYSVGGESWDFSVEFGDKQFPAKSLLADARSGVAILKIEADTPFLPIGRSDALEAADPVAIIGYFRDLPVSISYGPVSGFDRRALGGWLLPAHIRADVVVHPGQQGAPLLNLRGEVVGIVVGKIGDESCCALPIRAAEKIQRDFVRFGEARPGFLGVTISPSPEIIDDEGVETRVAELAPDSPAAEGGLRVGDVLLRVNDTSVDRPSDVMDIGFYLTGGDEVPVVLRRGGETLTVQVQAADEPGSRRARDRQRERQRLGGTRGAPSRDEAAELRAGLLRLEQNR